MERRVCAGETKAAGVVLVVSKSSTVGPGGLGHFWFPVPPLMSSYFELSLGSKVRSAVSQVAIQTTFTLKYTGDWYTLRFNEKQTTRRGHFVIHVRKCVTKTTLQPKGEVTSNIVQKEQRLSTRDLHLYMRDVTENMK